MDEKVMDEKVMDEKVMDEKVILSELVQVINQSTNSNQLTRSAKKTKYGGRKTQALLSTLVLFCSRPFAHPHLLEAKPLWGYHFTDLRQKLQGRSQSSSHTSLVVRAQTLRALYLLPPPLIYPFLHHGKLCSNCTSSPSRLTSAGLPLHPQLSRSSPSHLRPTILLRHGPQHDRPCSCQLSPTFPDPHARSSFSPDPRIKRLSRLNIRTAKSSTELSVRYQDRKRIEERCIAQYYEVKGHWVV